MASLSSRAGHTPTESLQGSQETTNPALRRVKGAGAHLSWYHGTWNVRSLLRSLLDNEGPIEIAWQGPACRQVSEDRRVDIVIHELQRYNICVAALQETKWFWHSSTLCGQVCCLSSRQTYPSTWGEHAER